MVPKSFLFSEPTSFPLMNTPLSLLLVAATAAFPTSSLSLPVSDVSDKLDTLIVYAPVATSKGVTRPRLLSFELDGKSVSIFFAAFSPSAAATIANDILGKNNPDLSKSLKFAPYSLSKFDSLVQPLLGGRSNAKVRYIPDPGETVVARRLLLEQGLSEDKAESISSSVPSVFCPKPSFSITPSTGSLKGKTFVPCSTNSKLIFDFVDKAKSEPSLKGKNVTVMAIPLTSFANLLATGSKKDVGSIRILPSPEDVKVISGLKEKAN